MKSFKREDSQIRQFKGISQRIYDGFSKGERLIALNSPLMQLCMYATMILISWLGAKAIIASGNDPAFGLTTGELTALMTYAMQILTSLMMLSMVFAMITIASSSAKRIQELLEEKSDITNPERPEKEVRSGELSECDCSTGKWAWKHPHSDGSVTYTRLEGNVELEHVDFSYVPGKQMLHDITLTAKPGDKVAFVS